LIPTVLPGPMFYDYYKKLYARAYPKGKLIRKIVQGKISFSISQGFSQMKYLKQLGPVN
jgi:hypothetical protein